MIQTKPPSGTVVHKHRDDNKKAPIVTVPPKFFYCQKKCPTLAIFMVKDSQLIGQPAVEKLINKKKPSPEDVRALAKPFSDILEEGIVRGLHEIIPTNQIKMLAGLKETLVRTAAAEVQSGLRFSTALTLFHQYKQKYLNDANLQIVAHTGVFLPATDQTRGQDAAHNELREALIEAIAEELSGSQLLNRMILKQLEMTPHGRKIIEDHGLTGKVSCLSEVGKITKPLTPVKPTKKGANKATESEFETARAIFAVIIHELREEVKDRARALKREKFPKPGPSRDGRTRSPSPSRTPIKLESKKTYSGGRPKNGFERPVPLVPSFPDEHRDAHRSAWVSEPMRLESKAFKKLLQRFTN